MQLNRLWLWLLLYGKIRNSNILWRAETTSRYFKSITEVPKIASRNSFKSVTRVSRGWLSETNLIRWFKSTKSEFLRWSKAAYWTNRISIQIFWFCKQSQTCKSAFSSRFNASMSGRTTGFILSGRQFHCITVDATLVCTLKTQRIMRTLM